MLTRLTTNGAVVAAAPSSPKALQRLQNCIAMFWPSNSSHSVQAKSTHVDAIDCFTNELVQSKTKKWQELCEQKLQEVKTNSNSSTASLTKNFGLIQKAAVSDIQNLKSPQLGLDIRLLSQAQLDNLLLSTLEIKNRIDFLYLMRQCILWQQLPSDEVLISCLKYLSNLSYLQDIESLANICAQKSHNLVKKFTDFAAFKAIALWRGGGTNLALTTLLNAYAESAQSIESRRMIRNAFRIITEETLHQKSEAVLVTLMEVARKIYIEQKDIFIVACVWKQCFISDWFCDQKTAADLFEHYEELRNLVNRRVNSLCTSFLRNNNIDAVHRLIEIFLQYKQRDACACCLTLLFDYQYLRKDLRACAEIVKSCSELEMPLSEAQNERFLSLFLNHSETNTTKVTKTTKQFQFKF